MNDWFVLSAASKHSPTRADTTRMVISMRNVTNSFLPINSCLTGFPPAGIAAAV
jgi:hypothetical protein